MFNFEDKCHIKWQYKMLICWIRLIKLPLIKKLSLLLSAIFVWKICSQKIKGVLHLAFEMNLIYTYNLITYT